MLLLRSRTASGDVVVQPKQSKANGHTPSGNVFDGFEFAYGASPALMDVGNLAPEQTDDRRTSMAESSTSDDMKGLPQFLARYGTPNGPDTDDEVESNHAPQTYAYAASSYEESFDAQRRQQEEEEQASAVLSQRAEEILANAKKRLNVG